jgi:hypothetical protein
VNDKELQVVASPSNHGLIVVAGNGLEVGIQ